MKAVRPFIIPIFGLIAFCLIWEFIVWANEWPNYVMASPSDLGPAFYKFGWLFMEYGWDTLWRTVVGLLLAIIFGVVVGMIMGFSRAMREALYPLLVGFNAIPKATVVPVVALWISAVVAFARSLGEFGATIMVAGNIEGVTRTIPLAIFSEVQTPGGDASAMRLVVIAVIVSFVALLVSELLSRRLVRRSGGMS